MALELKKQLNVPPALAPVFVDLDKLEKAIHFKDKCYSATSAIKSELYDIQEQMKVTFDRKINENAAVQLQKGIVTLENYGKSVQTEIKVTNFLG